MAGLDWTDLVTGLGLAAVVEGLFYALLPESARRAVAEFLALPEGTRRLIGLGAAGFGVLLVWLARG